MPEVTRNEKQRIVIDENISLTVLEILGNGVRIGIRAPKETPIVHTQETLLHRSRREQEPS